MNWEFGVDWIDYEFCEVELWVFRSLFVKSLDIINFVAQRRRHSFTCIFYCIVFTCFYLLHEVMRPQWRGRGSLDFWRWSCRQAPLHLHLRRAAGVTVAFHLSLLVVGVLHGVDMSGTFLRSSFVQLSPLYNNLSLVSKLWKLFSHTLNHVLGWLNLSSLIWVCLSLLLKLGCLNLWYF